MTAEAGHDATTDEPLDGWWKGVSFDELAGASGLVARFQAGLSREHRAGEEQPGVASPERVARAIVLRRLIDDDRALEALLELAEAARLGLRRAVLANEDLRNDERVVQSHRVSQELAPVLLLCGGMLRPRAADRAGKEALDVAEHLRTLLFDYDLLGFRFGRRSRIAPE